MPQIDEYGSTNVEGGIEVKNGSIDFKEEGIELKGIKCFFIEKVDSNIHKLEEGFEIEGGLYQKEAGVKEKQFKSKYLDSTIDTIEVPLIGTQATLDLAGKGKILVVFKKKE